MTRLFNPGFRLSFKDIIVLAVGTIAAIMVAQVDMWIGLVVAFVVLHFFLFCNVFRMPPRLELVWAGCFVLLGAGTLTIQQPGWPLSFALSFLLAVALVVYQMRQPSYHGVGWMHVNPALPQWWQAAARNEENLAAPIVPLN
jgi:predicted membrane channel-forming protein YqfA (hemolysin III family)